MPIGVRYYKNFLIIYLNVTYNYHILEVGKVGKT